MLKERNWSGAKDVKFMHKSKTPAIEFNTSLLEVQGQINTLQKHRNNLNAYVGSQNFVTALNDEQRMNMHTELATIDFKLLEYNSAIKTFI